MLSVDNQNVNYGGQTISQLGASKRSASAVKTLVFVVENQFGHVVRQFFPVIFGIWQHFHTYCDETSNVSYP